VLTKATADVKRKVADFEATRKLVVSEGISQWKEKLGDWKDGARAQYLQMRSKFVKLRSVCAVAVALSAWKRWTMAEKQVKLEIALREEFEV
jgi:hypothetical protein